MSKSEVTAMGADDKKWRAESDMRTLLQAQEIRADPARLKAAIACAKEEQAKLAKINK